MKQRQRRCVQLARPLGLGRQELKTLFEYTRDSVVRHNDTVQQHLGVIAELMGLPASSASGGSDVAVDGGLPALAIEMSTLARTQADEERVQRQIDGLLAGAAGSGGGGGGNAHDAELARALELSRQHFEQHGNGGGAGVSSPASPTASITHKVALQSAAEEAERLARQQEHENNYNKTLQEVILRSKIEAERVEADRLRKLMLDTAMASALSGKDHDNAQLRAKLMALEAKLSAMSAEHSGISRAAESTEEALRRELSEKEASRVKAQAEMERLIEESEKRAHAELEAERATRKAEVAARDAAAAAAHAALESKVAAHAALESKAREHEQENAVLKRALQRESKERDAAVAARAAQQEELSRDRDLHAQHAAELEAKLREKEAREKEEAEARAREQSEGQKQQEERELREREERATVSAVQVSMYFVLFCAPNPVVLLVDFACAFWDFFALRLLVHSLKHIWQRNASVLHSWSPSCGRAVRRRPWLRAAQWQSWSGSETLHDKSGKS